MTRYYGNEPDIAGPFYCSNCGKTQAPAEYCRFCFGRTNAALRYNVKVKLGRDGRRAGEFFRGPAERARQQTEPDVAEEREEE